MRSARPLTIAATAALAEPVPEARVYPTPRSQKRTRISPREGTDTNSTLVLRGKKGCGSSAAPSRTSRASSGGASMKTAQCGLPSDVGVTRTVSPATFRAWSMTRSRGGSRSTGMSRLPRMAGPRSVDTR